MEWVRSGYAAGMDRPLAECHYNRAPQAAGHLIDTQPGLRLEGEF